jgi:hypothetical protein
MVIPGSLRSAAARDLRDKARALEAVSEEHAAVGNKVLVQMRAIAAQASPAHAQTATGSLVNFFPGFRRQTVEISGTTINVVVGGDGPPVLLLHGYPQTHVDSGAAPTSMALACR